MRPATPAKKNERRNGPSSHLAKGTVLQRSPAAAFAVVVSLAVVLSGCFHDLTRDVAIVRGDPEAGKEAIVKYGCGSCHTIPGVKGADGLTAPPLTHFSKRSFVAGQLANTPDNLVRWITDPQGVEPGTAMPNLGVEPQEAEDIVAYLYSID